MHVVCDHGSSGAAVTVYVYFWLGLLLLRESSLLPEGVSVVSAGKVTGGDPGL